MFKFNIVERIGFFLLGAFSIGVGAVLVIIAIYEGYPMNWYGVALVVVGIILRWLSDKK